MNWRGRIALGWIVAALLILAALAWLTQNPAAEIVETAEDWPLLGPWASRFRQAYLPSPISSRDTETVEEATAEVVVIEVPPGEALVPSFVWVQPGTELHAGPNEKSPVLQTVVSIGNLRLLEQRGDWYRVQYLASPSHRFQAWVWLEDYQVPSPEVLRHPDPVLPLPATPPTSETISLARQSMDDGGVERSCGPYALYSDSQNSAILNLCQQIAQEVEEVYRLRFGVEPVGPPAEAILLFRRVSSYREFRDLHELPIETDTAHASAADGYLALYEGDRTVAETLGTLVHELAHLISRRSLGPGLPPWLSEGVADDLAESRIDETGSLHPGKLSDGSRIEGRRITRWGGVATALELQGLSKAGNLPTLEVLMEMDRDRFYETGSMRLHYALSSFWVRYLVSGFDAGLQKGFLEFLQDVADGEPITKSHFLHSVDTDWHGLEAGFRTWLHLQFLQPRDETRDESS
jgi:hypothetical protein